MNSRTLSSKIILDKNSVKTPQRLKGKDARCDPLASAIIMSIENLVSQESIPITEDTSVIVLTDTGCESHLEKVFAAAKYNRPKQGFFSRGGPQMLANYTSMAFDLHGASLTYCFESLSNKKKTGLTMIKSLMSSGVIESVLIAFAQYKNDKIRAEVFFVDSACQVDNLLIKEPFTAE